MENDIKYLNECIENDNKNIIKKIDNLDILKELYSVYLQYYDYFNSEFDSFNEKLFNLGTLVTVLLGFLITVTIFLFENNYVKSFNWATTIGITFVLVSFISLISLLLLVCNGQSFKKFLTLNTQFPLTAAFESFDKNDEKEFYKKMIFCIYKTARINYHNLEKNKSKFPNSYKYYVICVVISIASLVLIYIGGKI